MIYDSQTCHYKPRLQEPRAVVTNAETSQAVQGLHVGFIADGVRRWARRNNLELTNAYIEAMKRVGLFIDFFFDGFATTLSVYMLSKENLQRPELDLRSAIEGEVVFIEGILPLLVRKWDCQIVIAGKTELLPAQYVQALHELPIASIHSSRKLYLLAGYSPLDELKRAISVSPQNFWDGLWVREPVDFVIRTSGEQRLSGFLPLQSQYSELLFLEKHINEIDIDDYRRVVSEYGKRSRRYGR